MACWSAENATNAYLRTMRMGKTANEPNEAEFISALAAGNNVKFMVIACSGPADSTTLALIAASQQTKGRIICILRGFEELNSSEEVLGNDAHHVEFVVGDAKNLILESFGKADFVALDCNLENHESIIAGLSEKSTQRKSKLIVLGYNAFLRDSWRKSDSSMQLLPIGDGLLLKRIKGDSNRSKNSNWVVKVDRCTGEEHVFRVRSSVGRTVRA